MLRYLKYDNLNIDEELIKINNCKEVELVLEPNNKKCLFILGMLFANGTKIKILNEKDLNLETTNKSFSMMAYVWSRMGNDDFPSYDYSNVKTEMDKRIAGFKQMGFGLHKITNNPVDNRIFLICPVRNATPEQRKWIEDFVVEKDEQGYSIYAPHIHTNQKDVLGGYNICTDNSEAIAMSEKIDIYYDQTSTGSAFDLGVAYALNKPLELLNRDEIVFNEDSFIDNIVKDWPYNAKKKRTLYIDKNGKRYYNVHK